MPPGGRCGNLGGPRSRWGSSSQVEENGQSEAATREHNFEVVGDRASRRRGHTQASHHRRRGSRGPPFDLRGAPVLREAGRRADAQRGRRHRRQDLRHLPGRLPDGRVDGLRAPIRGRGRPPGEGAAPALLLGRMDREPRPPCLHAPRPGLPGLRERDRHGPRSQAHRRAGAAAQADRQRDHEADRRPGDPPRRDACRRPVSNADEGRDRGAARAANEALDLSKATLKIVAAFKAPGSNATPSTSRSSTRSSTASTTAESSRPTESTCRSGAGAKPSTKSSTRAPMPSTPEPTTAGRTCSGLPRE